MIYGIYNLLKAFVYSVTLLGLVIAFFYYLAICFNILEECLSFFNLIN